MPPGMPRFTRFELIASTWVRIWGWGVKFRVKGLELRVGIPPGMPRFTRFELIAATSTSVFCESFGVGGSGLGFRVEG